MASVWYTGGADSRVFSAADWTSKGETRATDVWNAANGWSIPASSFTAPQLAILSAEGQFNTAAPDGPRTFASSTPADSDPTPQYVQQARLDYLVSLLMDNMDGAAFQKFTKTIEGGIIAHSENRTGTPTSFSTVATHPDCCVVVIDPEKVQGKEVTLEYGALFGIEATGAGAICLRVYEITGGTAVLYDSSSCRQEAAAPITTTNGPSHHGRTTLREATTSERIFALFGIVARDAASALAVNFRNFQPNLSPSYLTAVAR